MTGDKKTVGNGKPGPGRPKGMPNKVSRDIKEMVLAALSGVGGQSYLQEQAEKNPTAFLTLVGKVLPLTVSGDPANPMRLVVETGVPRDDA